MVSNLKLWKFQIVWNFESFKQNETLNFWNFQIFGTLKLWNFQNEEGTAWVACFETFKVSKFQHPKFQNIFIWQVSRLHSLKSIWKFQSFKVSNICGSFKVSKLQFWFVIMSLRSLSFETLKLWQTPIETLEFWNFWNFETIKDLKLLNFESVKSLRSYFSRIYTYIYIH